MGKFTQFLNDARAYYAEKPSAIDFQNRFFMQSSPYMQQFKTKEERKEFTSSLEYKEINRMISALEAGEKDYSGTIMVRTAPSIHKALAVEAALEGVSLNQLCELILAMGLSESIAKVQN